VDLNDIIAVIIGITIILGILLFAPTVLRPGHCVNTTWCCSGDQLGCLRDVYCQCNCDGDFDIFTTLLIISCGGVGQMVLFGA
jgi:hypothetical protein